MGVLAVVEPSEVVVLIFSISMKGILPTLNPIVKFL
jgi:hypothetical protein